MALCISAPVRSQTDSVPSPEATPPGTGDIEEIVVTAQRRSEKLQDVPISVTAISPQQIEDLNLVTVKDVQIITPGLTFESGYNYAQPFIRGVGTSNPTPGIESAVATYVDGAYVPRAIAQLTDMFDMADVQVIKGAQGTLWGRNATGGALLYTTADPVLNEYSATGTAEVGNYRHWVGEAVTNVPLADTVALRLAVRGSSQAGYINNVLNGDELGGRGSTSVRGKVKWAATDKFTAVFTGEYYKADDFHNALAERAPAPYCTACLFVPAPPPPVSGFYDVAQPDTAKPFLTTAANGNVHLTYNGDTYDINSVTAYRHDKTSVTVNQGFASFPFFDYGAVNGGTTWGEELQAASKWDGMFNTLVGLSYNHDDSYDTTLLTGAAFAALADVPGGYPYADDDIVTESVAGFAELYVTPIDKLKFTFGGRYTMDDRELTGKENLAANLALAPPGTPMEFTKDAKFYQFTPRVVVAYDLDPVNVYASWNRGFKAGGFNTPTFAPPPVIDPELIDNYEVGAKYVSPDRRLRANLAGFYYNYSDIQVYTVNNAEGGQHLENAAKSTGYGGELDGSYKLASWVNVFGNAAYLHAEYDSYPDASVVYPCPDPNTGTYGPACQQAATEANPNGDPKVGLVQGTADLTGKTPPRAPRFTGSLGFDIHLPLGDSWTGNFSTVARYTTRYDFYPDAGGPLGNDYQPSYTLVNVTGYVEPAHIQSNVLGLTAYKIGFYVNNATDEKIYALRNTSAGFGIADQVLEPRTYGIRLSAAWGS
ncbi:MAG: hypothetical protein JWQ90_2493 [Hydrocarboniphaga sp.]|nr:hypothetical protein [Hydrocarboniphaga sp.]